MSRHRVFVTGGTGYVGRPLIERLVARGHEVYALTRPASRGRVPPEARPVLGDALDAASFEGRVAPADTLVHLVGTPHPNPRKAQAFRDVDLKSVQAAVAAAVAARVRHFVYVSVAQPAPLMRAYVEVRAQGEAMIRATGIPATFVRPWYVLGPGHRWPLLLVPLYAVMERLPGTADTARRLGLVTLEQMVASLVRAVETPPSATRVLSVEQIRTAS